MLVSTGQINAGQIKLHGAPAQLPGKLPGQNNLLHCFELLSSERCWAHCVGGLVKRLRTAG